MRLSPHIGPLIAGLLVALFCCGFAAFSGVAFAKVVESPLQKGYRELCESRHLTCSLNYGTGADADGTDERQLPPSPGVAGDPVIGGPMALVAVLGGLLVSGALWLRFGAGGVLLSQAPKEEVRKSVRPESWQAAETASNDSASDILRQLESMENRREAVIRLLHQCLLHAADRSGTRLMRSDTERTVFARLPADLANRQQLEALLGEAELVHYGGREVEDAQFARLLAMGRTLILAEVRAHG